MTEFQDTYRRDGYAIARGVFDADVVAEMDAHYEWLKAQPQPADVDPMKDGPLHDIDAFTVRVATDPRLIEVVEPIVGPDIALSHADYIPKYPGSTRSFGWHADAQVLSNMYDDMELFTQVWIAVDPATIESGCLRAMPGSHTSGWQSKVPNAGWDALVAEGFASEQDAVDVVLDPGDAFVFHAWSLHGSQPNRSDRRRCGFNFHMINSKTGVKMDGVDTGVVLQGTKPEGQWQPLPRYEEGRDFAFRGAEAFALSG